MSLEDLAARLDLTARPLHDGEAVADICPALHSGRAVNGRSWGLVP